MLREQPDDNQANSDRPPTAVSSPGGHRIDPHAFDAWNADTAGQLGARRSARPGQPRVVVAGAAGRSGLCSMESRRLADMAGIGAQTPDARHGAGSVDRRDAEPAWQVDRPRIWRARDVLYRRRRQEIRARRGHRQRVRIRRRPQRPAIAGAGKEVRVPRRKLGPVPERIEPRPVL